MANMVAISEDKIKALILAARSAPEIATLSTDLQTLYSMNISFIEAEIKKEAPTLFEDVVNAVIDNVLPNSTGKIVEAVLDPIVDKVGDEVGEIAEKFLDEHSPSNVGTGIVS